MAEITPSDTLTLGVQAPQIEMSDVSMGLYNGSSVADFNMVSRTQCYTLGLQSRIASG